MVTPHRLSRPRVDLQAVTQLAELADYTIPFCIRVVCELRLADELVAGPRPVAELAGATGSHAPTLLRVLRVLASRGIFAEAERETFALTPLAQPLRSDHALSLVDAYPLLACDIFAWARLDHSVRTGEAAFDLVHGTDYWAYMAQHPDENRRFNASQRAASGLELRSLLAAYPWRELTTLVDVGGGNGAFLAGLLARFRHLQGTVFDLPHVVAEAPGVFASAGVADRALAASGSFLDPDSALPQGADGYLLKRVLYHWSDDDARILLRNIRSAMQAHSRLLVLEPTADPVSVGQGHATGLRYDLLLLTMAGGGAREVAAITDLLHDSGLRMVRTIGTHTLPILECAPA